MVTPVTVGGNPGYWISGPPHFFYYVDPSGKDVDDSHRIVGDTLHLGRRRRHVPARVAARDGGGDPPRRIPRVAGGPLRACR